MHHFLCALNCKIRKRIGGLRQFRKSLLSGQIITGLGRARKDLSVAKSFLKTVFEYSLGIFVVDMRKVGSERSEKEPYFLFVSYLGVTLKTTYVK